MERYLGAKIKELRQSRNWTQAYLAERLNKSVSTTWSRKTNGRLHAGTVSFADKNC